MTLHELVTAARTDLVRVGIPAATAALDADLLARHVLAWDRATWLANSRQPADEAFEKSFAALIARRCSREPVAYIRGVQEFWNREFIVTPAVLIPRPETELVVEIAAEMLTTRPDATVVDVGTGSGCIAVTLALEYPTATIYATDVSAAALAVARENAARLGAGDRVRFLHGAHLAAIPGAFDLIVSNPPYIAGTDRETLPLEVRDHEPAEALFGGEDGLREIRELVQQSRGRLRPAGRLLVEIGCGQAVPLTREVAALTDLALQEIRPDLQGIPRVAVIRPIVNAE